MSKRIKSNDAEIFYDALGKGPDVVLLHPFPLNHNFWGPVAESLANNYRVILPDLRGHGDSTPGDGPATMEKHAGDIARVCDDAGVGRAIFAGVSIGGYVLFELWRRDRARFAGLVLSDTKAAADTEQARAMRLKAADDVEKYGPEKFIEAQIPRLLGETTCMARPDKVDRARQMMRKMTVQGIAAVQRGMAQRPDSTPTLATISVPTLLVFGEEDVLTTPAEGRAMQQQIAGSKMQIIPRAGHYAMFEQPEDAAKILRTWLEAAKK
jgi:pimeloyl-ACP methyl ester carboxylesterase